MVLAVTVFAMTTHAVVVVTIADAVIYEDDWSGDDSGDEESETKDARALRDGRPALNGCALRNAGLLSKGKARKVKAEAKEEAKEEETEEKPDAEDQLKRESSVGAAGERRSKRARRSQA